MDLTPNLALIARDGTFTAAAARAIGLDSHALRRLAHAGDCLRLSRGLYAVGPIPDEAALHALRARALGAEMCRSAAISHYSVLALRGLPTFGADLTTVHLTRTDAAPTRDGISRRRRGLKVHRPVRALGRVETGPASSVGPSGPASVPLAVAIVQAGLVCGPESALVAADAALHQNLCTAAGLDDALGALRGYVGIGAVRAALRQADGRVGSPGESRTGFVLRGLGFTLVPQFVVVAAAGRYRADFRIAGTRVLVEFDGRVKYAAGGDVLFAEKLREDELRRAGWVVVRITWADLADPIRVRARVVRALELARG
jgi:hypothetical protein